MAIGMTRLSMRPASIGLIKELVLNVDLKPIQDPAAAALSIGADGVAIRSLLQEWVEKQNSSPWARASPFGRCRPANAAFCAPRSR